MLIEITVIENRTPGMGLRVFLADDAPVGASIDERTETRVLWMPDGSEVYTTVFGEACVRVPGRAIGMTLTDAYHLFGNRATAGA